MTSEECKQEALRLHDAAVKLRSVIQFQIYLLAVYSITLFVLATLTQQALQQDVLTGLIVAALFAAFALSAGWYVGKTIALVQRMKTDYDARSALLAAFQDQLHRLRFYARRRSVHRPGANSRDDPRTGTPDAEA